MNVQSALDVLTGHLFLVNKLNPGYCWYNPFTYEIIYGTQVILLCYGLFTMQHMPITRIRPKSVTRLFGSCTCIMCYIIIRATCIYI